MIHRRPVLISAATVAVAAIGAGGAFLAVHSGAAASASGKSGASVADVSGGTAPSVTTPPTTAAPPQLSVAASSPAAGAKGVDGSAPLVVTTSAPVDSTASMPQITPSVPGAWSTSGDQLTFTPTDAFAPLTTYTVTIPAGLRSTSGGTVGSSHSWTFTTEAGSVLWMQQLLARLGYLPLNWTAAAGQPAETPGHALYHPQTGQFAWTWSSPPATLVAAWSPGQYTAMTKGAVMAFEADHGLAVDGVAGPQVWGALFQVASQPSPQTNQHGYTYALAQKSSPETLTVWHDGTVLSQSPANTGIAQAPTPDGTFAVYERLKTQIMRGTNPNGTKYADPVAWVAYFNGGDAIHYIPRSSYGSPQSLGCVEVSYPVGQHIWPYLTYGSLVTVSG